ncbi:MAG: NlpC/P60 family protein [Hungatella sp.]
MKKKTGWMKQITCVFLIGIMLCVQVSPVWATSKVEKEKKEAQEQLEEANQKAQEAEAKKNAAQLQMKKLNSELMTILSDIQFLEIDMANKEAEIAQAEKDYDAAKTQEAKQYAAMKKRIQYMYEKGDTEYLDVLLRVKSMADLLNKAEYVEDIYTYDRKMLTEYQELKQQVADFKTQREEDKAEMEVMELEYQGQKKQLETLIANKRGEVSDFDSQMAQARLDAKAFAKTVELKNNQIQKIKADEARKKAEAEARRKAAEAEAKRAAAAANTPKRPNNSTSNDRYTGPAASKSSGGTAEGRAVADYGLKFVGNPYVYGGTSLTNGTDCSGFTQGVYRNFGVSIPRTSGEQRSAGREVSYSDAQPGDLICYAGHVGIYIGNGQIVHASSPSTGIKVGPATYRTILSVRRIL